MGSSNLIQINEIVKSTLNEWERIFRKKLNCGDLENALKYRHYLTSLRLLYSKMLSKNLLNEKIMVGIIVNSETFEELKKLSNVDESFLTETPDSFYNIPVYLKKKQNENYKIFYDRESLLVELKSGEKV